MGGNTHFCWGKSAVLQYSSFETFLACNSYELQLFHKSVKKKGRAEDRSVIGMFLVCSSFMTDHSITHSISKCGAKQSV